jgi:hypothetical protein
MHQIPKRTDHSISRLTAAVSIILLVLLLSGCSALFGSDEPATTTAPVAERQVVPTFTPTPLAQPTEPPATPITAPTLESPTAAPPAEAITATTPISAPIPPTPAPTVVAARLTVTGEIVNLRSGPGTAFDLVGTANLGQNFELRARNAQGDWWQVCCVNDQPGWVYGELASVENADALPIADAEVSTPADATPTPASVAVAPTATPAADSAPTDTPTVAAPAPSAPVTAPDPASSSAGFFDPNAQYQIVHFKVLGLDENNGGIRDSSAQHLIFLTVLDQNGNGVDGAVVKNLVGEKGEFVVGNKGPGKTEITMYYEPFKLVVASDPSGAVTSQVSNQMGLAFPHLPDLVGKLGDVNYEYGACPTLEIKCQWPIQAIHFSYEITFQKVK